jgi:phosphatidylglycerophosphate synthase
VSSLSTAILTGQPVPGSSLEGDLRSLGFDVRVASDIGDVEALLTTTPADQRVALVDARFVGHPHALRLGLTDPRFDAAALPGTVTARPDARQALTRALTGARAAAAGTADAGADPAGVTATVVLDDPADLSDLPGRLAAALDADGVPVHRPELGSLVATVPADPQARNEARQAVAAVDDEAVRLKSAVKSRDGFFTTYCISPYSRYIARWCARRGLTPNQVTTASLLTALIAAGCAATGTRPGFVAAGVLLIASFVLDCTDGQLARYSLQYSTLGAWLDATFDRAKEYAYYAGLALGAARYEGHGGHDDVWALALGAMVLQTCRHVVDFSFNEANVTDSGTAAGSSPTASLSGRLDRVGWTVWLRRMIVLPIGERWAMIAVLTALTTPRTTFVVLLVGCALAALYTTAGRVLRSLANKTPRAARATRALADLADAGPLTEALIPAVRRVPRGVAPFLAALGGALVVIAAAVWGASWATAACAAVYVLTSAAAVARPLTGALDWLVPPFFRAAEYGTVLVLAAKSEVNGALPTAFGLVAAVAYHHYDTVYRIRGNAGAPPRGLVRAIGGHDGRTLLVAVLAAALTATALPVALTVLAVTVALAVLAESIRFWVSAGAPAVHDEGETA